MGMVDHGCPAKFSHIKPCCCPPMVAQCLADGALEHPQAKASRCAADAHAHDKAVTDFAARVLADATATHGDLSNEEVHALATEARAEARRHLAQEQATRDRYDELVKAETAMIEDLVLRRSGQIRVRAPE